MIQKYIRKGIYSIDFVLSNFITDKKEKIEIDDIKVKTNSQRYILFKEKGIVCVACGIAGKYFALEKATSDEQNNEMYHFNLYAVHKNNEILMTKDHIIPKSKGGKNNVQNYQTMCIKCNEAKGNKLI